MFGWLRRAASDASLTNISTSSGRCCRVVNMVLMTTRFILARHTSAIPPVASSDSIS